MRTQRSVRPGEAQAERRVLVGQLRRVELWTQRKLVVKIQMRPFRAAQRGALKNRQRLTNEPCAHSLNSLYGNVTICKPQKPWRRASCVAQRLSARRSNSG